MDDEKFTLDVFNWSFPEVGMESGNEDENHLVVMDENNADNDNQQTDKALTEENLIGYDEIESIRANFEEKILVVNNIIDKLKYPMSIIDDELIEIIQDVIKKIVVKIIHKEIQSDPKIISQMIKELIALIEPKDGMVSVNLSKDDYKHLEESTNHKPETASVNESLKNGDIIIKSNFSEVRAIMSDRIDNLLRIQYE